MAGLDSGTEGEVVYMLNVVDLGEKSGERLCVVSGLKSEHGHEKLACSGLASKRDRGERWQGQGREAARVGV